MLVEANARLEKVQAATFHANKGASTKKSRHSWKALVMFGLLDFEATEAILNLNLFELPNCLAALRGVFGRREAERNAQAGCCAKTGEGMIACLPHGVRRPATVPQPFRLSWVLPRRSRLEAERAFVQILPSPSRSLILLGSRIGICVQGWLVERSKSG